jgi:hypothetical protein
MKYTQTIRSILIPLFAVSISVGSAVSSAADDIQPQVLVKQYTKTCAQEWFKTRSAYFPKEEAFAIQHQIHQECRRLALRHVSELVAQSEEKATQAVAQVELAQSGTATQ